MDTCLPPALVVAFGREDDYEMVSIDTKGRNLFEEQKVVYNQRKEAAKQAIYPEVKFIK